MNTPLERNHQRAKQAALAKAQFTALPPVHVRKSFIAPKEKKKVHKEFRGHSLPVIPIPRANLRSDQAKGQHRKVLESMCKRWQKQANEETKKRLEHNCRWQDASATKRMQDTIDSMLLQI